MKLILNILFKQPNQLFLNFKTNSDFCRNTVNRLKQILFKYEINIK